MEENDVSLTFRCTKFNQKLNRVWIGIRILSCIFDALLIHSLSVSIVVVFTNRRIFIHALSIISCIIKCPKSNSGSFLFNILI